MTIQFVDDTRLQIHPHGGLTGCWYVGLPEYEEMVFLLRLLRPSDVFYDIGANAGAFTILAASRDCTVFAFEPVPQTFAELKANAELNQQFGAISVENLALGATSGTLRMTTDQGTGNRVCRDGESAPSVEVRVTTLDAFAEEHRYPTIIKMDVEGHELEVIRAALSVLARVELSALLVETFRPHNFGKPKLQEIERILSEFGFRAFDYDPHANSLRELHRVDEGAQDTLYLRDASGIQARLRSSTFDLSRWGIPTI
ncbi:MAG: FkbM family methyltransferase [Pirellulales bacterium]